MFSAIRDTREAAEKENHTGLAEILRQMKGGGSVMLPICMICGEEHEGEGEDHLSFCCDVCGQCGFCVDCAKPGEHDDCEPRG